MTHTYEYPRPMVACTAIIHRSDGAILVGLRKGPTEEGKWSLPGGFLNEGQETARGCVRREVLEETGLDTVFWMLFGERSRPETDPRGHVVNLIWSHPYDRTREGQPGYGKEHFQLIPGDDLVSLGWFHLDDDTADPEGGGFAFDHLDIIRSWVNRK